MESKSLSLVISSVVLLLAELAYFKIADRFNIIDKPNERSSHVHHTIRGGGVVFFFSVLIWFYLSNGQWSWFVLSVVIVAIISFLDDVTSLNVFVRFLFQIIAITLLFYQMWPTHWPVYLLVTAGIVCVGTLNAFNFMDGINGITGIYAAVMVASFLVINQYVIHFTDNNLLLLVSCSLLIFLFFNFRKQARCFAGDVGSVTIALILIFFLLQLIRTTHNFLWPLLFLVYGTDSIITIVDRLKRKENIFKAHRTHLFQYLSNEMKIPQLVVASGYGLVQGALNVIIIFCFTQGNYAIPIVVSLIFITVYEWVRLKVVKQISKAAS